MAIYNVQGVQQLSAYSKSGNAVDTAYDIEGGAVFSAIEWDYDNYSVGDAFLTLTGGNYQGFAFYNGCIAQFQADDKVTIVSVNGETVAPQMYCKSYHGQSAFFMNQFYQPSDVYPLLYVMGTYTTAWINRVSNNSTTLVKAIYIPTTSANGGYKLGCAYNSENGHMYTLGYTQQNYETDDGGNNKLIIAEWDLNTLTDNGDNTYTPLLISVVERDFIICIQGSCYHDGMIWASSGIGTGASKVYAINPQTAEIMHTITLSNVEIEGCCWVNNDYLIVGQSPTNIAYKKVTFAELS